MTVKNSLKYHIILAVIFVLMGFFSSYVYLEPEQFLNNFKPGRILLKVTFLIVFFSIYAINFIIVCPKTLHLKNKITFFIAVVLMVLLFAFIRYILEEIIVYNIFGFHNYFEKKRVLGFYVFDNTLYAIQAIILSTLMYLFFKYIENKDLKHKLEIEQKQVVFDNQLNKLINHVKNETLDSNVLSQINKKITIKVGKSVSFVSINTISSISASGSYIDIKTINKNYVLRSSLDKILTEIDDRSFVRIHRSTIINIDFVDKLLYSDYGEVDVKMKNSTLFRVSNSYKKEFLNLIGV